ncbi:MAG: response regulator [Planctomycetes bacterium]|nr:response regulator [Planctomycetota bacterium]
MSSPRQSLRRRLTALCALLTVAALGLSGVESYRRERSTLHENMRSHLATVADMVAVNSRSGLEFDDTQELAPFLATVTATMGLQAVAVYTGEGKRFAAAGDTTALPGDVDASLPPHEDWVELAALPYRDVKGESRQGTVMLRASGAPIRVRLQEYLGGLGLSALLTMIAVGLAAHWLLTRLLRPIANLVETTNTVRSSENWSLRAQSGAEDEVGALVEAFNALLQVIQERELRLAENADRLEQEVKERTAELRHALQAAQSATRAKSTFVANMSHEIRTPLNAILGMTELAMGTEDPREIAEYLTVIRSAGSNLLGILCDILDLSKIESEKLELSPVPTELESLVLDALRPLTARIQSKDLELSFELAPQLAPAYLVDDVRLRQILTNLVGNAIKFTASGEVRVELRLERRLGEVHELLLVVQDTGVGIPQDRLQAIFTPFTQADSTITRRFAGTGLGLSITDRLVRLMGGVIQVESSVGVGTTFRVLLPLPVCASPLPPPPPLPDATRITLVGTSPAIRRSLATIGRRLGLAVVAVDTVQQLRELGPPTAADLVLVDERDPDHDGRVCDAVPIGPLGVRPVFLVTSFQDLASASARCRQNGFAGYVTKPMSARELAVRASQLLRLGTKPPLPANRVADHGDPEGRALRVLVAEDNAVNQKLIERILQRDGHAVTIAENGRICCELWAKDHFDLVLMDMQMPEMSGLEATMHIRRQEANSGQRVPIVALTANTTPEDRQSCLHAGMDEVLPKPVSIPRLRAMLAQFGTTATTDPGRPDSNGAKS